MRELTCDGRGQCMSEWGNERERRDSLTLSLSLVGPHGKTIGWDRKVLPHYPLSLFPSGQVPVSLWECYLTLEERITRKLTWQSGWNDNKEKIQELEATVSSRSDSLHSCLFSMSYLLSTCPFPWSCWLEEMNWWRKREKRVGDEWDCRS